MNNNEKINNIENFNEVRITTTQLDNEEINEYVRYSSDNWMKVYSNPLESYYDCKELEELYQEYISKIQLKNEKFRYKIWNWDIEKNEVKMSMNPTGKPIYWYSLNGISDKYEGGYPTKTSKIIKIDFDLGIVETLNSIYELQSESRTWPFSNKDIKINNFNN